MEDDVKVEDKAPEDTAVEVPQWAVDIMNTLADIKAMLETKAEEKPEEKPEDDNEEKLSVGQATEMAVMMTNGFSKEAAVKMATAGVKYAEIGKPQVAIKEVKPTTPVAPLKDEWDWEAHKELAAFDGCTREQYAEKMEKRAHFYFPNEYALVENKVMRRK